VVGLNLWQGGYWRTFERQMGEAGRRCQIASKFGKSGLGLPVFKPELQNRPHIVTAC
jgi:hypothetical protein